MLPATTSLRFTPLHHGDVAEAATWMAASPPWRDLAMSYGRLLPKLLAYRGVGIRMWDGEVVGVAFLDTERPDTAGIAYFAVRPDQRRRGVGDRLLGSVELDLFRTHSTISAQAPTGYAPAAGFFLAAGYRASMELRGFRPDGVDVALYVKNRRAG